MLQSRKNESVVAWLYQIVRTTLAEPYRARKRCTRREAAYAREQAVQAESPGEEGRSGQ